MTLAALFAMAFVTGLSGAMTPGPFLTVTIAQSAKRGGKAGPLIVLGHGLVELLLVILILLGPATLFNKGALLAVISFVGGIVLIYLGIQTLRVLPTYSLSGARAPSAAPGMHPVLSGVLLSLSNPYWYIWWITVAMGYLMFAKTLGLPGVAVFFVGHVSADLAWFSFVSYGMSIGGKYLNVKVLRSVLFVCSLFLLLFGAYFLYRGFRFLP